MRVFLPSNWTLALQMKKKSVSAIEIWGILCEKHGERGTQNSSERGGDHIHPKPLYKLQFPHNSLSFALSIDSATSHLFIKWLAEDCITVCYMLWTIQRYWEFNERIILTNFNEENTQFVNVAPDWLHEHSNEEKIEDVNYGLTSNLIIKNFFMMPVLDK